MSTAATGASDVTVSPPTVIAPPPQRRDNVVVRIFENIGIFVGGALVLTMHILLYKLEPHLLSVFLCTYIITFAVILIVWLCKNKSLISTKSYETWMYASVCTILLETVIIVFVVVMMMESRGQDGLFRSGRTSSDYNSYTR